MVKKKKYQLLKDRELLEKIYRRIGWIIFLVILLLFAVNGLYT